MLEPSQNRKYQPSLSNLKKFFLGLAAVLFISQSLNLYEFIPEIGYRGIRGFPEWEIPMESLNTPKEGLCREASFLVAVRCTPYDFWFRDRYRRTYGRFQKQQNFRQIFVIGRPANATNQTLIDKEANRYGDILQSNYLDSYRNITYKTVAILNYHTYQCNKDSVVLKIDDDVFWRVATVSSMVERFKHVKEGISCVPLFRRGPVRRRSKWIVTEEEFNGTSYPPYCQGATFFIKQPVSARLLNALPYTKFFWIDDVYITGIVREAIGEGIIDYRSMLDFPPGHWTNVFKAFEQFNSTYPKIAG